MHSFTNNWFKGDEGNVCKWYSVKAWSDGGSIGHDQRQGKIIFVFSRTCCNMWLP